MYRVLPHFRALCAATAALVILPPVALAQPAAGPAPTAAPQDPDTPPPSVTRPPGVKAPADVDAELEGAEDDLSGAVDDSATESTPTVTKPAEGEVAPTTPPAPTEPAPDAKAFTGVRGKVLDANTGEGLIEAQIKVVKGGKQTALSDVDGSFELELPPGEYEIRVFTPLYTAQRYKLVIEKGETSELEVKLSSEADATEEVVVVAAPDTATAAVEVMRRRKRASVSDAISAEQISRSPDSSASDAAKRVVGATIQDNRYVIVRGLGGRYSLTLLNGVPLPSPDPDVPAAPLDMFPAALLANLTVIKTFSADMPGNFAGGAMTIESRSYPAKFMLKAKASTGFESESTFQSGYAYHGGGTDVLGYDDGTRALPDAIPRDRLADDRFSSAPREEIIRQQTSFKNNWTLQDDTATPNGSLGLTLGDTVLTRGQRLGYLASVNYDNKSVFRATRIGGTPSMDGTQSPYQFAQDQDTHRAGLGGLLTAGWTPSAPHRINLVSLYTHTADDTAARTLGTDVDGTRNLRTRLSFVERQMFFSQLFGEHDFASGKLQIGWQGNIARVAQDEPDTRELLQSAGPDGAGIAIQRGSGTAERLFGNLGDVTGGGGLDITVPLDVVKLKAGGTLLRSSREYQVRRFHFEVNDDDTAMLAPDEAFSAAHAGTGVVYDERTLPSDGYQATRNISAGYLMADFARWDPIRFVGGARFEQADLDVNLVSDIMQDAPPAPVANRSDRSILPTASVVYGVTKDSALRAGYAMTVARPNFREIAPAQYFDYARRRAISGNPMLEQTTIHNADLRWETYLGPTELVAASVFYKHFVKPIERTLEETSSGQNVGFVNAPSADLYGLELEARASVGRVVPALSELTLGANLSIIHSQIGIAGVERPLQGQSPYVANLSLGYDHERTGTQADLLYNVFGSRIEEVGAHGNDGNVYEESVHRLDLTVAQRLSKQLKLKLAGTNLLAQRASSATRGFETYGYPLGVTVSATMELSVE